MMAPSPDLHDAAQRFLVESVRTRYSYNFEWMSRPIIQYPQDMIALQEIVWRVRPDVIVETGIAHGGSLMFSASLLALLDYCDAQEAGEILDPAQPQRKVIGVDIDIRAHNRKALDEHPMRRRMELIEGSSISADVIAYVRSAVEDVETVMVCLDSHHAHDHVLAELKAYADLVTPGSYCIVFDTVIEDLPDDLLEGLSWGKGDSPKSAVHTFLASNDDFSIDTDVQDKIMLTVAPDGYLLRCSKRKTGDDTDVSISR